MKKIYSLLALSLYFTANSQTILDKPETTSRTVQDPTAIILSKGFHATSSASNPFVAKIGTSNDNSGGGPADSNAGSTNPSGTYGSNNFHDTQGNIEVNGGGQLQFTLPIALPLGVKSVAPQVNLIYTSGSGNGIAGYGWSLSGITSIARMGKTIEKDGEVKGVQLDNTDYYSFNGQRLILKQGSSAAYGQNGAEYITEKYSNVKIKSLGTYNVTIDGTSVVGPEYWEVTFEDGSQAWYGATATGGITARTPIEYNIAKWKDPQGNYITYNYTQSNNVAVIDNIQWGGNETLGKSHFNKITFNYIARDLKESSYVNGVKFLQDKLLNFIQVDANGEQFKKYEVTHTSSDGYPKISLITELNSQNQPANPIILNYQGNPSNTPITKIENGIKNSNTRKYGDFDFDGVTDFIEMENNGVLTFKKSVYLESAAVNITYNPSEFTLQEFSDATLISYKKDNLFSQNAGIVVPIRKYRGNDFNIYDYEFRIYAVNLQTNSLDYKYSKTLKYEDFKAYSEYDVSGNPSCTSIPSSLIRINSYDCDGDGISELLLDFTYELTCYDDNPINQNKSSNVPAVKIKDEGNEDNSENFITLKTQLSKDNTETPTTEASLSKERKGLPDNQTSVSDSNFSYQNYIESSSILFDLKEEIIYEESFYKFNVTYSYAQPFETADFNGDGIEELYQEQGNTLTNFFNIKKSTSGNYSLVSVISPVTLTGLGTKRVLGDFNGDGKMDMAVPQAEKSYSWKFYLANGKGFESFDYGNFVYFSSNQEITGQGKHNRFPESGCNYSTITLHQYQAVDLDQDGKSEIVVNKMVINNHQWNAHSDQENTTVTLSVYSVSKPSSIPSNGNSGLPFSFGNTFTYQKYFAQKVIPFQTLFINKTNQQIILVGKPDDCPQNSCATVHVIYLDYKHVSSNRIRSITQGNLTTDIDYGELIPGYFYKEDSPLQYPFVSISRANGSYVVQRLTQESRWQDFRYRGLVSHLQGKGMIGFRQTARSSWYASGFNNTKIWSGAEIDPLKEGVPIKEWSIKTNDENQIFPVDISLSNTQLLSLKLTDYKKDYLVDGILKTEPLSAVDKPKAVLALVPTSSTTKDFQKDVKVTSTIEYGNYYLPSKTITKTYDGNTEFATSITSLDYEPANLTGVGSNYYVGRPKSKTELMTVYGDSKGAKEEYAYENNQLKSQTTYNRDGSGWVRETYTYDGFGNVTEKLITNKFDTKSKTSKATYDTKGRFVEKKTEIAGSLSLETNITYNNWGQVLTQIDALGNTLTNTYDGWGKLLTSKTNLGGTTTYQYEKLYNGDAKVTQNDPDGGISVSYTNKIGQNYKSTSKVFGSGNYVSKEVKFDELGRKVAESEPYKEGQGASQWNTIEYDDYSRPIKATAFTGKIVESVYSGRTATVTETNANNRFKKQVADPLGNIVSTEDKGGTIYFKYNAAGENIEAKYGENIVTTKYDNWGRKSEFYDPSNGLYKYEYSAGFGELIKEISPKGYKEYKYNNEGQLYEQREVTTDGTQNTDKTILYTYNNKGMVTGKTGTTKGKENGSVVTRYYGSSVVYDTYGRVLSTSESSNDRYYMKKGITYDDKGRVTSYEKSLYSAGVYTKAQIENVYEIWSGELYQVKDKTTSKILWELKEANAKSQVTKATLGASEINNIYDVNGFLSSINHKSAVTPTILQISYSFNAIKNELNSRTTGGDFNILESFEYDDNNRLVNWTDPVTNAFTGGAKRNVYDAQGRIRENDQLGSIKFENNQFVYRPTKVILNPAGEQNLTNDLVQSIVYNENNDPIFINGAKGDVRFEYGLTEMRQRVTYGGNFAEGAEGRFTKSYSEDGSYEIIRDNQTGQEKHLIYIGGTPYESNIVFVKNYTESSGSYKFLHKDYLGSVLAITDEAGNKLEQRHFDAWGNLTHLKIGNNATITDKNQIRNYLSNGNLIVDRGYTSHEHFAEVGLIHMNGRLYDPLLRRFLNADENIQNPHNTQNYNKYGYVLNNPLMYNDPSGEFAFLIPLLFIASYAVVNLAVDLIKSGFNMNIGQMFSSLGKGALAGAMAYVQFTMGLPVPGALQWAIMSNIPMPAVNFQIGSWNFSLSLSVNFGQGFGFGLNGSVGYDDGNFSIAAGFGITSWSGGHFASGKTGIETRISAMAGYRGKDFGVSLGTNFWSGSDGMKEFKQQTGFLGVRSGDWSFTYENDGMPMAISKKDYSGHALLSPRLGNGNDSYRTNAVTIGYQDMTIGINLFTGKRDKSSFITENAPDYDGYGRFGSAKPDVGPSTYGKYGEFYKNGLVYEQGQRYRFGGLYIGMGNYRMGLNSEWVRHYAQNIFAHGIISSQRMFEMLSNTWGSFNMYKTSNPFTSW